MPNLHSMGRRRQLHSKTQYSPDVGWCFIAMYSWGDNNLVSATKEWDAMFTRSFDVHIDHSIKIGAPSVVSTWVCWKEGGEIHVVSVSSPSSCKQSVLPDRLNVPLINAMYHGSRQILISDVDLRVELVIPDMV